MDHASRKFGVDKKTVTETLPESNGAGAVCQIPFSPYFPLSKDRR